MPGMVIIGAGECGTRAALHLREAGYDGPVTLVGTERHLPYERPPLSKAVLVSDSAGPTTISGAADLCGAGIDFRPRTTVVAIDRQGRGVLLNDGSELPYERLLIATGARPRSLAVPGADGPTVTTLRTLEDAMRIRAVLGPEKRLTVIGGGFIGLEVAASARRLGADVTVVEALPRLLTRGVPIEIAGALEVRHRQEGVGFRFEAQVVAITAEGVELADGSVVASDLVVAGIGAVPETALAAAAGLVVENGIAVDARLGTEDPAILAAGDCCSFLHPLFDHRRIRLECWRGAQEQGALAARNMLGHDEPIATPPWFWSDQYDLTLQLAGLVEGSASQVRRDLEHDAFVIFHIAADGRLLAASGLGCGNAVAKAIRLAEMMIASGVHPQPAALADPAINLRDLMRATAARSSAPLVI